MRIETVVYVPTVEAGTDGVDCSIRWALDDGCVLINHDGHRFVAPLGELLNALNYLNIEKAEKESDDE